MNDRFFLDTNIFAYSFDPGSPQKAKNAKQLILRGIATRKGVVSYQVVQEFFNVAFRKFSQPMTTAEAEQYLQTVFRPMLAIQSSQLLFSQALQVYANGKLSWYDSLIIAAALESQCKILYTEDLQHGRQYGELQILNPFL